MQIVSNREITIAVLPFQILGDLDHMNPTFLGFTEDLIINFSKYIGLSVISQYSTQHISDISDKATIVLLGADYLITGSFRSMPKGIRIGVQLIRTDDHKVVFAGNHDETLESILSTQDTITNQMVSVLQQQIDHDLLSYSYKKESVELAAYENWLMGMNLLKRGTVKSDLEAREHFEAALKINPRFARAYTGISLSYFNEWSCQLWDRWDISQKGAHDFALKAIEIDENDYISLAVLGRTFLYLGDFEKSEHYLRKSLRMNPNDADNLILIAFCMVYLGLAMEAEQLYLRAKALNPLHPDVYFPHASFIYFELGDFQKSMELADKVADQTIWTDFPAFMAATHFHLSNYDKAKKCWDNYLELFRKNINNDIKATTQEAIEWQKIVNPYKVRTQLEPFWDSLSKGDPAIQKTISKSTSSAGKFIFMDELWELVYRNERVLMKDSKGLHDIAKLLEQPEKQFHCSELMGSVLESDGTLIIDDKAIKEYKRKINDLRTAIADAEEMDQTKKAEQFRGEYETLLSHLSQTLNKSGRGRKIGASVEKARSAVTWRIRNSIKKIEKVHPALAKHLNNSIKTGAFCTYFPEFPHTWQV